MFNKVMGSTAWRIRLVLTAALLLVALPAVAFASRTDAPSAVREIAYLPEPGAMQTGLEFELRYDVLTLKHQEHDQGFVGRKIADLRHFFKDLHDGRHATFLVE